MDNKKEVLNFCESMLEKMQDNYNWSDALIYCLEENSPEGCIKIISLIESGSNWDEALSELTKMYSNEYASFCLEEFEHTPRTKDGYINAINYVIKTIKKQL